GEHADRTLDATGQQHGVAVDHTDHRIVHRHLPGQGAEGVGQTVTFAGAAGADDDQLDVVPLTHFLLHDFLDEAFVRLLDDRDDHRAGHRQALHFLEYGAVHLVG